MLHVMSLQCHSLAAELSDRNDEIARLKAATSTVSDCIRFRGVGSRTPFTDLHACAVCCVLGW